MSQPVVQLQGYTPEELKEITYDWIGPSGAHSNQPVYVVRVLETWEPQEPTTNFWQARQITTLWQAFDVPLVPGTNLIILRARDLADNLTVTNVRFHLDYSRDTTPPVLRLHWPLPGTRIAGESFTCRGWMDDPTATLTAVRVQPPGQPQEYRAVVERDGFFWIYDLPLEGGTNHFLLTAADGAGNVHQTQFWVLRGTGLLTIDPILPEQLRHPPLTVTGTCLLTNHTLWVNGVRATVQGSRWVAEGVPLPPGSMAIIQVRAIPNEDNQGQGTGGGTPPTYENLGNPVSPQAQEGETNRPQPWRLFASEDKVRQSMYLFTLSEEYEPGDPPTNVVRWAKAHHWYQSSHFWSNTNRNSPEGTGTGRFSFDSFYLHSDGNSNDPAPCSCDFYWPIPDAPGFAAVTNCECYPWPWVRTPPLISEYCHVSNPEPSGWTNQFEHSRVSGWYKYYHRHAQTRWTLFTGGAPPTPNETPTASTNFSLWTLRAWAYEVLDKRAARGNLDRGQDIREVPTRPIEPTRIRLLGAPLDPDGCRYVVLRDGLTLDLTPKVEGVDFYTFEVQAAKHKLVLETLTFRGTNGLRGPGSRCYDLLQDTNGLPYPIPHWTRQQKSPVLYVSGTRLRTEAFFRSLESPPAPPVEILGRASNGHLFRTTNTWDWAGVWIDVNASSLLPPSRVDFHNPLRIDWFYCLPARSDYVFAGTTTNPVYVSLQEPLTFKLFHTVVHLACARPGAATEDQAVASTWSFFTNRNVATWDRVPLTYYRTDMPWSDNVASLLRKRDGDCNAWADLLEAAFQANGVRDVNQWFIAPPENHSGLAVKQIHFQEPPRYPETWPYVYHFNDLEVWPLGLPGQNMNPPAEKRFNYHRIVRRGLTGNEYYDPAYGITTTGPEDYAPKIDAWAKSYYSPSDGVHPRYRKAEGSGLLPRFLFEYP